MVGFVWLFWLCCGAAFLAVGVGSLAMLLVSRRKQWSDLATGSGLVFGVFCVAAVAVWGLYV